MEKTNFAQKLIFELTHNWSIANKGAKSLGVCPETGHRIYEIVLRKTNNIARLHLIVNDNVKVVVVEPNKDLTITDYVELNKIGKKVVSKVGVEFECDEVVENNLSLSIVKRKSTKINEKVEIHTKPKLTELDKLNMKIEKLVLRKAELEKSENKENKKVKKA